MQVRFYEAVDDELLQFAVIIAKYQGKWVFCRHRERTTDEIPGGHREPGESIEAAARRELEEETGAIRYTLSPVCVYSVEGKTRVNKTGEESFGMLYFAEIQALAPELHSEMACIRLLDGLPETWTYPQIQPLLLAEYCRRSGAQCG